MTEDFSSALDAWLDQASDRYEVAHVLKQGGGEATEVVYERDDQGHRCAGPFVRKRFALDASRGHAYEQIFRAQLQGMRLPHQPMLYACRQTGNSLEVVMEYVRGVTLRELVQQQGPGVHIAARIMPSLCDAISELHERFNQPLIHRDIKPSNIMVTADRMVVVDLGIARTYRADAQRDTVRYGTPGYAPPEQFGYGQTSVRSDVYALGMTLAFCLTGEDPAPHLRESGFADPRISPAFRDVLVHATELDPELRYMSARALKNAIGQVLCPQSQPPTNAWAKTRAATRVIGVFWNVVVIFFWALMLAALSRGIPNPTEGLEDKSVAYRATMYVGAFVVPLTVIAYLLLDKRRIRPRTPFAGLTWRQELPIGLAIIFASIAFTFVAVSVVEAMETGLTPS